MKKTYATLLLVLTFFLINPIDSKSATSTWTANTGICNGICLPDTKKVTLVVWAFLGGINTTIIKAVNFTLPNGSISSQWPTLTVGESMILTENSTSGSWFTTGGLNDSPLADGLLHEMDGDNTRKNFLGVSVPRDLSGIVITSNNSNVLECHPTWGCTARNPGQAIVNVDFPQANRGDNVNHKLIGGNWGYGIINILSESLRWYGVNPGGRTNGLVYSWHQESAEKVSRVYSFTTIQYTVNVNPKPNGIQTVNCEMPTYITRNGALFNWGYWDPEGDAQTNYHAQVATDPGFSNIVWQAAMSWGSGGNINNNPAGGGGNIQIPAGTLASGTEYYSRIAVHNNVNGWGNGFQTGPRCGGGFRTVYNNFHVPYCNGMTNVSPTGATFNWGYSDADGDPQTDFHFQLATDAGFSNVIYQKADSWGDKGLMTGGGGSINIIGLDQGKTYYTRIATQSNAGWFYWKNCGAFETAPPQPTNIKAVCNSEGTSASITWTIPSGYSSVYLRGYNNTLYPTWNDANVNPNNDDYRASSYTLITTPGHGYSVWLHTKDLTSSGNRDYSDSAGIGFTCNPPPPILPPTNVTASCSADGKTGTVSWVNTNPYNTVYFRAVDNTIYPDTNVTNIWTKYLDLWNAIYDTTVRKFWNENLMANTKSFTTTPGHDYSWWIHTKDVNKSIANWSNPVSGTFKCNQSPLPPPPTNLTATCAADSKSVTISWDDASGYSSVYFRAYDYTKYPKFEEVNMIRNENYTENSFKINNIIPNNTYSSWVHTKDLSITEGRDHSDPVEIGFTCKVPKPISASGSCSVNGTTGKISWTKPAGYNNFILRVVNATLHTDTFLLDDRYKDLLWNDNVVNTEESLTTIPGNKYLWWMYTRDAVDKNIQSDPVTGVFQCPIVGQGVCSPVKNTCLSSAAATLMSETLLQASWTCPSVSPIQDTSCTFDKLPPGVVATPPTIIIKKTPAITLNKGGNCKLDWTITNISPGISCLITNSNNGEIFDIKNSVDSKTFTGLEVNTKYTITCSNELATPVINASESAICRVNPFTGEI